MRSFEKYELADYFLPIVKIWVGLSVGYFVRVCFRDSSFWVVRVMGWVGVIIVIVSGSVIM